MKHFKLLHTFPYRIDVANDFDILWFRLIRGDLDFIPF
jgi:hypothetical protein